MPISGSWIATSAPPHKKHPAASSGYFSLHCGHDFMTSPHHPLWIVRRKAIPASEAKPCQNGQVSSITDGYRRSQSIACGRTRASSVSARSLSRPPMPAERRQPLKIEVPDQKQETLRFGRVGLIVTAGFLIGIVWPRIAGFKLVPSVPSQPAESSSADLTGAPGEAKGPAPAPPPVPEPEAPAAAQGALDRLQVSEPQFLA